ncbi:putative isomerase YbhE [Rhizodiscina lignyota]|uniref:Isomerase YbhE n=1 Tax=Rhizodiscina lignyota TaxID=1504668 RepID=A0A9P4I5V0_9PEZI|nr:putative isomerase YbhE [Rhizodiscina lignyota]
MAQNVTAIIGALAFASSVVHAVNIHCRKPSGEVGAAFALTNAPDDNKVIAFSRDRTGKLTQTGEYSTGGKGQGVDFDTQGGLQLSRDHRFLYAISPSDDRVSVFSVSGSCLERIQVIYGGDQPLSITLNERFAYVLDGSVATTGIRGYEVGRDGKLAAIGNTTIPTSTPIGVPGTIQFSPDGKGLIVTNKVGSTIDFFNIDRNGEATGPITISASSGNRPFGAQFREDGTLFVVESGLPVFTNAAVSTYHVDTSTGALKPITKSEKNQQTDGCWVILAGRKQQFAFTANFVSGTIASYTVSPNGAVSILKDVAANPGIDSNPVDLAVSADGAFLYDLLRGTGAVQGWAVENDGSLRNLGVFGRGQGLPVNNGASGLTAF